MRRAPRGQSLFRPALFKRVPSFNHAALILQILETPIRTSTLEISSHRLHIIRYDLIDEVKHKAATKIQISLVRHGKIPFSVIDILRQRLRGIEQPRNRRPKDLGLT